MNDDRTRDIPRFSSFTVKHASATGKHVKNNNVVDGERPQKMQRQWTSASLRSKQAKQLLHEDVPDRDFCIDSKGDELNLSYGSLHKYSVPRYHRAGGQRVLGLSPGQIINNAQQSRKDLVITKIERKDRVPFEYVITGKVKRIKLSKVDICRNVAEQADFVPLSTYKATRQVNATEPVEFPFDESSDDSGTSSGEEGSGNWQSKQNLKFSQQVEREPQNIDAWLDFVEWQADYNLNAGRITISDLRQAICEKALKHNPHNERLLIRLLREKSFTLNANELVTEWMAVLQGYPESFRIWYEYLSFQQTELASFSLFKTCRIFQHCFNILRESQLVAKASGSEPIEQNLVYLLSRYVYVLTESGYSELATACMQAIVEFVFFAPQKHCDLGNPKDFDEKLDDFERFWESECPRFGESGAHGWANWIHKSRKRTKQKQLSNALVLDDWSKWSAVESAAAQRHYYPARLCESSLEVNEDFDPFFLPVLSDIKHVLFHLDSKNAKAILASVALDYLGFGAIECLDLLPSEWKIDQYMTCRFAPKDNDWLWPDPEASSDIRLAPQYGDTNSLTNSLQLKHCPIFPFFVGNLNYSKLPVCVKNCLVSPSNPENGMKESVARLTAVCEHDSTGLVVLMYAWTHYGEWSLSLANTLSTRFPHSIFLLNMHAKLLYNSKQEVVARTLLRRTIDFLKSQDKQDGGDIVFAWKTWAELELCSSSLDAMLLVLFEMNNVKQAQDGSLSVTGISRCRRQIHSEFQKNMASLNFERAIAYCQCLFLLEYGVNIEGALAFADSVHKQFTVAGLESSPYLESFTQLVAQVLTWHAKSHPVFQKSVLRDVLEGAIHHFPQNSFLLSAYAWNEATARIQNRTRNLLQSEVLSPSVSNCITWLHALYIEFRLSGNGQYNVHAVRNLFERASKDEKSLHCIELWRLYIKYEVRQGQNENAKKLLFRAFQACPWAKELYMLAFTDLAQSMTREEMKMIYNVMMEKDLRLFAVMSERSLEV